MNDERSNIEEEEYLLVEECEFAFKCPKLWLELQKTDDPDKRFCNACNSDVFVARDRETLERYRQEGRCVATNPTLGVDGDEIPRLLGALL